MSYRRLLLAALTASIAIGGVVACSGSTPNPAPSGGTSAPTDSAKGVGDPTAAPARSSSPATATTSPGSPNTSKPPTPTATGTSQAAATVPPGRANVPAKAKPATANGAQAFAEYYIGQINKAWTTAEPSQLDGLTASECKLCATYRATAVTLSDHHQRFDTRPIQITSSVVVPTLTHASAEVDVLIRDQPAGVRDSSSRLITRAKALNGQATFRLERVGRDWIVVDVKTESHG